MPPSCTQWLQHTQKLYVCVRVCACVCAARVHARVHQCTHCIVTHMLSSADRHMCHRPEAVHQPACSAMLRYSVRRVRPLAVSLSPPSRPVPVAHFSACVCVPAQRGIKGSVKDFLANAVLRPVIVISTALSWIKATKKNLDVMLSTQHTLHLSLSLSVHQCLFHWLQHCVHPATYQCHVAYRLCPTTTARGLPGRGLHHRGGCSRPARVLVLLCVS